MPLTEILVRLLKYYPGSMPHTLFHLYKSLLLLSICVFYLARVYIKQYLSNRCLLCYVYATLPQVIHVQVTTKISTWPKCKYVGLHALIGSTLRLCLRTYFCHLNRITMMSALTLRSGNVSHTRINHFYLPFPTPCHAYCYENCNYVIAMSQTT